jgi:hypothetical protein
MRSSRRDGCKALQGRCLKIAEQQVPPVRATDAVLDDFETVGSAHESCPATIALRFFVRNNSERTRHTLDRRPWESLRLIRQIWIESSDQEVTTVTFAGDKCHSMGL